MFKEKYEFLIVGSGAGEVISTAQLRAPQGGPCPPDQRQGREEGRQIPGRSPLLRRDPFDTDAETVQRGSHFVEGLNGRRLHGCLLW